MNRQFGALSGLAIIFVVINHSIQLGTTVPQQLGYAPVQGLGGLMLLVLQQLGIFAVPIFMFISGCFVVYVTQNGTLKKSYRAIWSRLRHILWPYVVWSVIFYVLVYAQSGEYYTFLGYVKNLLVGYPFNFVPLFLLFYLLSPLLVRLAKHFSVILIVAVGLYQLALINELKNPGALGFSFPDWMHFLMPRVVSATLADWAIYFPLGIVYGLHGKTLLPVLYKFRWVISAATVIFFVLHILNTTSIVRTPILGDLAPYLAPVMLMGLIPLVKRASIPLVPQLEWIGKMSYGLYLTNLIVADVTILILQSVASWLLTYQAFVEPLIFISTLGVPLAFMYGMSRLPIRTAYRYVFG
jgi:hypothetical protein